jgi:signal transduction histidine kinase/ligand-binding sensor domain-containing protein
VLYDFLIINKYVYLQKIPGALSMSLSRGNNLIMRKTISLFLLLLSFMAKAQISQPGELYFNHLFVKDGMPEGTVTAIVQDKEGYMWIGTQKGLVRYDGYNPKVYNFGIEDPYSQDVHALYLDREDRLWVGGENGLLFEYNRSEDRFDQYKPGVVNSNFSHWPIDGILEDQHGNIWQYSYDFSNKKGLVARFDLLTKKFTVYDDAEKGAHYINATRITSIAEDTDGEIWFGSNNGIYKYNKKTDGLDNYLAVADSAKQHLFFLSRNVSQPGILWMFGYESRPPYNGEGLWRLDTRTHAITVFRHRIGDSSSIGDDKIHWMLTDSTGRLWSATDNGLSFFDSSKNNFINYRFKDQSSGKFIRINEVRLDKDKNFWLATSEQGLILFNTENKLYIRYQAREKDPNGLVNNYVHSLFLDHSGTLWFGAEQIGLQWINKPLSRLIRYQDDPGQLHYFPGGVVHTFAESKDSTIWLGSAHGLYHWNQSTDAFTLVSINKNNEKNLHLGAVFIDKEGLIWCAALGKLSPGLYCYNPKTGKTNYFSNNKNDTNSLSNNFVSSFVEDHLGNFWVGTYGGGICRFNRLSQNFIRYPSLENNGSITENHGLLDDNTVLSMNEDKNGTLWVGTNFGGLNKFDRRTSSFTSYIKQLPGFECIGCIYSDDKNGLWIGTYFGGVFNFDPQTSLAKKYGEKDGLLYDGATGLVKDNYGNLWLSTFKGISILNLQTKQVRNLTVANGLPSENLLGAFKTSNGRFLFNGADGGFISIKPDDFTPDPQPILLHIVSVDFLTTNAGKAKDSTFIVDSSKGNTSFIYNENRLSFHYVGLDYQNPQLIQYAYRLDGYDKDWITAGTQRIATYTNLSPGDYTFHVKASNSDGVWDEKGVSFSFTILPPWWQTWWAYTLYLLMGAFAVWTFTAYRSRNLRRANLNLEEKVQRRTIQLNKSLEDLKSTQSQLIQSEKMASLGELTAGIAHEIQNPLNFVNNFSEVNKELIEEMEQEIDKGNLGDAKSIAKNIRENEEKINRHGKRADAIVKGMLQHSRSSTDVKEPADLNLLADEYLRLSYQGLRAKDKSFNVTMKTDYDQSIGDINIIPQDIGRVLLNLYNNAFYAVSEKKKLSNSGYEPTVVVSTRKLIGKVEISVKDNGIGISQKVKDKIFQPFFTTKPTGQGTGLGLSLSYDIIKAHGGEIKVETREGEYTEFVVQIPEV